MIAYEPNNDFCYDTDVFTQASNAYSADAQSLTVIKESLVSKIDKLRTVGWKSNAGNAFFDKIDQNWAKDIERYVDLMNDLSTMIKYAGAEFEKISEQAKLIKYQEDLKLLSEIASDKVNPDSLRNQY